MYYQIFKRCTDILIGGLALVLSLPILIGCALAIRLTMGPGVLFRQQRPGMREKPFGLMKFRTMTTQRSPDGLLLPDEQRLTPLGQFLRKSSLDELPTLINVIKGDMSLVGPRPLLMEYLPLYTSQQARRHDVKPGMTGWAQIHGRNAISWERKFELDLWYVEHRGIRLDIKILLLTLVKVLKREGISAADSATMPKFTGSKA